jgi:hypothetical protein
MAARLMITDEATCDKLRAAAARNSYLHSLLPTLDVFECPDPGVLLDIELIQLEILRNVDAMEALVTGKPR